MNTLSEKLRAYAETAHTSFHMPGHKERGIGGTRLPLGTDITEIEGFDDLHHPEGVLLWEMERAAQLYGSAAAFLLVGGATAGNLAGIYSAARPGDEVIIARNCHKSVYNAVQLRGLRPVYVQPQSGILQGPVDARQIEGALREHPKAKLVVITSPTYEGTASDVARIAAVCHEKGAVLMVDAAHGAHFAWSESFPECAVKAGADIVVTSLHKTLPSMTGTALLLIGGERVDINLAQKYLGMFQTSSPSYVMLESISECLGFLSDRTKRDQAFSAFADALEHFYEEAKSLRNIRVLPCEKNRDCSKIVIIPPEGVPGTKLEAALRERSRIYLEMAVPAYALALASVCDKKSDFDRLLEALTELDREYDKKGPSNPTAPSAYVLPQMRLLPCETEGLPGEWLPLEDTPGRICAQNITPYPPGIPLLVAGEVIGPEQAALLRENLKAQIRVEGLRGDLVCVVNS